MKNNNSSIKTVVAVGIGAALFFVLGRFVAIPSPVPNTNISLQYAVLGLLAAMYGPVAGGLIGFIGHALIDLSWGGTPPYPVSLRLLPITRWQGTMTERGLAWLALATARTAVGFPIRQANSL